MIWRLTTSTLSGLFIIGSIYYVLNDGKTPTTKVQRPTHNLTIKQLTDLSRGLIPRTNNVNNNVPKDFHPDELNPDKLVKELIGKTPMKASPIDLSRTVEGTFQSKDWCKLLNNHRSSQMLLIPISNGFRVTSIKVLPSQEVFVPLKNFQEELLLKTTMHNWPKTFKQFPCNSASLITAETYHLSFRSMMKIK